VLDVKYKKSEDAPVSSRKLEPFAIYHNTEENWTLIAWCRLRNEFRNFRIDRIQSLVTSEISFEPHKITMEEFVQTQSEKYSQ